MSGEIKIQVFKLANALKARLGARFQDQESGFLAPDIIEEADRLIEELCLSCPTTLQGHLDELNRLWAKMREMPENAERADLSRQIFTLAHEIKDVGSMCGYDLLAYFAGSLRDYIIEARLSIQAQVVIVQAHLDAMQVAQRQGYKTQAGPEAEELKAMVRKAIEKYQ